MMPYIHVIGLTMFQIAKNTVSRLKAKEVRQTNYSETNRLRSHLQGHA